MTWRETQQTKVFWFFFSKKNILSFFYLGPLLLALAVVTPPWQNPDEFAHMLRAVEVAHGGLFGYRAWGTTGGQSDPAIYDAYKPILGVAMHPEQRVSRAALAASGAVGWHRATIYTPYPTVEYSPAFYLPAAAAYWVGYAASLSVNHTLLLARAANGAVFALIAGAALTRARRTRLPLLAILLLPTTLALGASANQDSPMLACTALVVAMLDRAIAEARDLRRGELWLSAVLLAAIGMARPPYAGFLLCLLLAARPPAWAGLKALLAAATVVLAWCVAVALLIVVRRGHEDPHAQLAWLAADPARVPSVIWATARTFGADYVAQTIGVLGWTDTRLPTPYIAGACGVLALAGAAGTGGAARRPWLPLCGGLFAVFSIFVLQYFTWTWPGQPYVTGVLGRYFLPIMMVLALAVPRVGWAARLVRPAAAAVAVQAIVTPAMMFHALLLRYYIM